MAKVKAPAWCEHAVPTANGWEDPMTGELFISGGHTQSQIDEWHGIQETPQVETLIEAPVHEKSLEDMTKLELESLGRQHGIELDRRKNKGTLINRVMSVLKD